MIVYVKAQPTSTSMLTRYLYFTQHVGVALGGQLFFSMWHIKIVLKTVKYHVLFGFVATLFVYTGPTDRQQATTPPLHGLGGIRMVFCSLGY